jgi:hypothetical protein
VQHSTFPRIRPQMRNLDNQIRDVLDVVSLTLVFLIAYLSATYPRMQDLVEEPRPDEEFDRRRLANKLDALGRSLVVVLVFVIAALAVIAPVTTQVLADVDFEGDYSVLRAGFVLVNVMIVGGGGITFVLARRLRRRARQLKEGTQQA